MSTARRLAATSGWRLPTLHLRADASATIGYGHVLRCLALAQAWRKLGGRAHLWSYRLPESLPPRFAKEDIPVSPVPSPNSAAWLRGVPPAAWVVLDGYRFGRGLHRAVREHGARLLVVADGPRWRRYEADLIVDPNGNGEWSPYRTDHGVFVGGAKYALLRAEFRSRRPRRRAPGLLRLMVLTGGGGDPGGLIERIVGELDGVPGPVETTVVAGSSNPRLPRIKALAERGGGRIRVVTGVDSMGPLLRRADLAVSAAGTTAWELATLGVPAILTPVADNQKVVADAFRGADAALVLDSPSRVPKGGFSRQIARLAADEGLRRRLSAAGRRFVDARGAERVARLVLALSEPRLRGVSLRPAQPADSASVWHVSNHPAVRERSFERRDIPVDEHRAWYRRRLADPRCRTWVMDVDGVVFGQVKYHREAQGEAEVGVSLVPPFWGRGLASWALERTFAAAARELRLRRVNAYILPGNAASIRAFDKAGYRPAGVATRHGRRCLRYVRSPRRLL